MRKQGFCGEDMGPIFLMCSGVVFIIEGLILLFLGPYLAYEFSYSILTEVVVGMIMTGIGTYLIHISRKQYSNQYLKEASKPGEGLPFYYELEPSTSQRQLPPIPKDIGRDYDPIVMDKV